ncbi:MAG: LTA synthase family protein [Bacteroidales bacterium]|nr:LTA synthase family protein [Bacteroidales bacterium]
MKQILRETQAVILFMVSLLILWLLIFASQRVVFLAINSVKAVDLSFGDMVGAFWHGGLFDMSIWGYCMILSLVAVLIGQWFCGVGKMLKAMGVFNGLLMGVCIFLLPAEAMVYKAWGHHADVESLSMVADSPELILASAETWFEIVYFIVCGLIAIIIGTLAYRLSCFAASTSIAKSKNSAKTETNKRSYALKGIMTGLVAIMASLMIIPIRGGLGLAPLNTGMAYFSQSQFANHTAVNPIWNFIYSAKRAKKSEVRYNFVTTDQMDDVFEQMMAQPDEFAKILKDNGSKPNVVVILLESFSAHGIEYLGGYNATPSIDSLRHTGVYFNNFFASSDRSGKGLLAVMCGHPSLPTLRIIQYPQKTQKLPFVAQKLRTNGYESQTFIYGGDIGFNNFNSLVNQAGFDNVITENDFSSDQMGDKWGAHDQYTFDRLLETMDKQKEPFFDFYFTLSSHEPYTVPMEKEIDDEYLNSMRYTDKCLGDFMQKAKTRSWWNNTLFVLVADHGHVGPDNVDNTHRKRFNIPLIFTGGALAVSDSMVTNYGTQTDIACTLLSQLNIDSKDFVFSRNLMVKDTASFAFFDFTDGFGYVTPNNYQVYDNPMHQFIRLDKAEADTIKGMVYLQKIAEDFHSR